MVSECRIPDPARVALLRRILLWNVRSWRWMGMDVWWKSKRLMWRIGVCGWTEREIVLPLRVLTRRDSSVPMRLWFLQYMLNWAYSSESLLSESGGVGLRFLLNRISSSSSLLSASGGGGSSSLSVLGVTGTGEGVWSAGSETCGDRMRSSSDGIMDAEEKWGKWSRGAWSYAFM